LEREGGDDNWFGELEFQNIIDNHGLKLFVDCGSVNATWSVGIKRYMYNRPLFDKIIEALKGVDCSDTYMLTSIDRGGIRKKT